MARAGAKRDRRILVGDLKPGRPPRSHTSARLPAGFDAAKPEASYRELVPASHRKRLAQFFTPQPVASLMTDWVMACAPKRVLDPSVGTGVFVREVLAREPRCPVTALDVDPLVLAAARRSLGRRPGLQLCCDDFLTWSSRQRFNGVLANPPYLKHHDFHYAHGDIFTEIGERSGVRLSRMSNLYVLFILEICRRLERGGRAAIIVPGEWVNANYGRPLKQHLLDRGLLRVLIAFAPESQVFGDALTTASVLLLERGRADAPAAAVLAAHAGRDVPVEALQPLIDGQRPRRRGLCVQRIASKTLRLEPKWDALLTRSRRALAPGFVPLSALARTCRGIATGANQFFLVGAGTARAYRLRRQSLRRCVGRALDAPHFVFAEHEATALEQQGKRVLLLDIRCEPGRGEQRYLERGRREGLPGRYLLAARSPWYAMERRPPSAIWAAVFGRKRLRFVLNTAGAHNLTAFHCVYPTSDDPLLARALVAALNSRLVQHRLEQHQRIYGGGLKKLEPRDLLEITVPDLGRVRRTTLRRLAAALDALDRASRQGLGMDAALDRIDARVADAAAEAGAWSSAGLNAGL